MNIFDNLKKDEIYSVMCLMLYATSNNPKFATLNELVYLTDRKSFLNILKYFEGQTIQIPTVEESQLALRLLLIYHYYRVEKMEWNEVLEKVEIPKSQSSEYLNRLIAFENKIKDIDYQTGGIKNVIDGLKS